MSIAQDIAAQIERINGAKSAIATAIAGKGVTVPSGTLIDGMADLIDDIPQGTTPSGTLNINANGTYDVTDKASAAVAVPNTYAAADEGKVVSNGTLVAQTSDTVTQNGTVDTTLINSLTVNVSGGGGGDEEAPEKDVNFIDYDGKILYSYTAAEAQALSALPANPSHSGLTAQGWNWTLAEIKAQLTAVPGGPVWVGQMYVTTSGATEIDVVLVEDALSPYLCIGVKGTTVIDWGDGTSDTVTGTNEATTQYFPHTYPAAGSYTISISGGKYRINGGSGLAGVLSIGSVMMRSRKYSERVIAIRMGSTAESAGLANYPLQYCTSLQYITLPSGLASLGQAFVGDCFSLRGVVLPRGYTGGSYSKFNRSVQRISVPPGHTTWGTQAFQNCDSLMGITIPNGTTAIGNSAFSGSPSISKLYIPATVTSIGTSAFQNAYSLQELHLFPTTPPTLAGTNALTGYQSYLVIYVPYSADHSVLAAYQAATNWSTYASIMQEEPQ